MKIPSHIKITSKVTYEIVFIPEFPVSKAGYHTFGECRPAERQIVIAMNQSSEEMMLTLIHEFYHALCIENKIEIPHKAIHQLEKATLRVVKLNKWLK